MRKSRDGENTKESVLSAAKYLFAEHGYAGTSLAMISARCGISDGLILHHFKTKQNLYHLVLEDLAKEYARVLEDTGNPSENFSKLGANAIIAAFKYWSHDTLYNRISMWAYLENQPEIAEEETRLTLNLERMISKLQETGKINPNYSPLVLLTLTIGPIHFWVRYRDQFIKALSLEQTKEQLDEMFIRQFTELILTSYRIQDDLPERGKNEKS